ncbi:MAG: bifunctional histidinol-phosphatase/imidazoleglycerol-phosphate dehydratase HisB [Bacteroidales bacterium]|nr:bifunctional histidinol-phosphatase/imidazoleglycerol-phosphate dehydratase HisB [Bacteroidales bacterium]
MAGKKVLFIDRDGTLIVEPQDTFQIDSLERLEFLPGVFRNLHYIRHNCDYELVMVSNQDGLGTPAYPQAAFDLVQNKLITYFANEGVFFDDIYIDPSLPHENSPGRKPGTAMLTKYFGPGYNLAESFVIGDRLTDIELARNLGASGILISDASRWEEVQKAGLGAWCALISPDWNRIAEFLMQRNRYAQVKRTTRETDISVSISLDGKGTGNISTGIGFFDHMLDQIARHSGCDISIRVKGDLHVDEHHTIEDVALCLGEGFRTALGDMKGVQRYGFALPMDESRATVLIDFGGRPFFRWKAVFRRERIGEFPAEMFPHFFRSFADAARCNLHITASGENEHHKAEAIFKAFARALGMAISKNPLKNYLPSTKDKI